MVENVLFLRKNEENVKNEERQTILFMSIVSKPVGTGTMRNCCCEEDKRNSSIHSLLLPLFLLSLLPSTSCISVHGGRITTTKLSMKTQGMEVRLRDEFASSSGENTYSHCFFLSPPFECREPVAFLSGQGRFCFLFVHQSPPLQCKYGGTLLTASKMGRNGILSPSFLAPLPPLLSHECQRSKYFIEHA